MSSAESELPNVVLSEPARQRLLTIVADVLGRLPPEQVPAALRPVARFTPAKRVRLGGALLSAALDADDEFRERVADVVAESSAQLAEAVRRGEPTTASDPLDTSVVAYLLRADGWRQAIADANARWAAQRQETGAEVARAELTRLRTEIGELRAQLRGEPARIKDAVVAALDEQASELFDLRRQLRNRSTELQAVQRRLDDTLAELADAQSRLAAADAARDAEARRARGRIAELERTIESVRRENRAERDVDEARLWLLVDTVTEAAAGIRRELSLTAPDVRPADTVSAAAAREPRRSVGDPAGLDRLLALPHAHLIVDGYNVTKTGYGELALADQRTRLLGALAALAGRSGAEITVAFDGGERPPALPATPRGIRVLFSAPDEIADDLIRRLVAAEPPGRPTIVVTSDHQVQRDIQRAGAWAVPSDVLLARVSR